MEVREITTAIVQEIGKRDARIYELEQQIRNDLRQVAGWPTRTFNEWLDELPLDDNGLPLEGAPTMRMCLTDEQRRIAMMAWDAARDQA